METILKFLGGAAVCVAIVWIVSALILARMAALCAEDDEHAHADAHGGKR